MKNRTTIVWIALINLGLLFSCQKNQETAIVNNQFNKSQDTLRIKMKKVKGMGLFGGGLAPKQFKDISEVFTNKVTYPEGIESLQRHEMIVDFKPELDTTYVDILKGSKDGVPIFIVDENNNKDFRDDPVRELKKIVWGSKPKLVPCTYEIFNGKKMVRDSSWLRIGDNFGSVLIGKNEHHLAEFSIEGESFSIATSEPLTGSSFAYLMIAPKISIFSKLGIKKDSIGERDVLNLGEVLDFNGKFYRFDNITNDGSYVTLVKDQPLATKTGTQVGMKAQDFSVVSTKGEALTSQQLKDKITVVANSCRCGGDIESMQAVADIKETFGDQIHVLQIDNAIRESLKTYQIDTETKENKAFNDVYRKAYCSRIVYVIGKDQRLLDKFKVNDWKQYLPELISQNP